MKTSRLSKKLRKTGMVAMVAGAAVTAGGVVGCDQRMTEAVATLSPEGGRRPVGVLPQFDEADLSSAKIAWPNHNQTFLT